MDGHGAEEAGKGQLTLNLMLSLDPATVGKQGCSHIVEIGESFEGNPLTVPGSLSPFYGRDPWSVQAFVRMRPPSMHRMWDTIMTRDGS